MWIVPACGEGRDQGHRGRLGSTEGPLVPVLTNYRLMLTNRSLRSLLSSFCFEKPSRFPLKGMVLAFGLRWEYLIQLFMFYWVFLNEGGQLNFIKYLQYLLGFPDGSKGKESACNAGDSGSIPGSGRSPGEGNGSPLQYSYLENSIDRGAWQATDHRVAKSPTRLEWLTWK